MCALSSTLRPATTNAILVTASSNFMPQYRSRLFQGTRNTVYLSRRIKRVKWWVGGWETNVMRGSLPLRFLLLLLMIVHWWRSVVAGLLAIRTIFIKIDKLYTNSFISVWNLFSSYNIKYIFRIGNTELKSSR